MILEQTIEQKIYTATRAKEILDNEVLQLAFEEIDRTLWENFRQSPARDSAGREKIKDYQVAVEMFKSKLMQYLETGKLALLERDHKRNLAERIKQAWQ